MVAVASVRMSVDGPSGSGDVPSFEDFRNDKRMRIRFTKKTNIRLPRSGGVAALVASASVHPLVIGLQGSGCTPSLRTFGGS